LWVGTLGMYGLGKYISVRIEGIRRYPELFASTAAFLYLFNLSTLSVFYFPMMMYVTRYMMLPTTVHILLRFISGGKISKKQYLWYLAVLFIGIGAYMVPTIFVTMIMVLGLLFIIFRKTKRLILVLAIYILLNAFWLLPFANYTIQKGEIVPNAPTFVDISEAMLNKPKEFFSFERQAKLRPSFFESEFNNNASGQLMPFHPLAGQDEQGVNRYILWIFPLLYLSGITYVVVRKRNKTLLWLASVAGLFLILSMKEYSPLGFIYGFMIDHVPLASTVFRFGDTKFHAMIAFSGSLLSATIITSAAGITWKWTTKKVTHIGLGVMLSAIIISQLFVFKTFFDGNMVGFFMYNQVPQAYFDIAKIINDDQDAVRVIHLPYDNHTYWKPYSWGYFGSPFFHFMINKPLFDRAFEPASEENALIHKQIMDTLHMSSTVPEKELLEDRATALLRLFQELGIKYVVDDGTISTNIDARNIAYWGDINPIDTHIVFDYLADNNYIQLVKTYDVDPNNYTDSYSKLYPYNRYPEGVKLEPRQIYLYEIPNVAPQAELLSKVDSIHSAHSPILDADIRETLGDYIQDTQYDDQALIYPFGLKNIQTSITNEGIHLNAPLTLHTGNYIFEQLPYKKTDETPHVIQVRLGRKKTSYVLTIHEIPGLSVNGTDNRLSIANPVEIPLDKEYTHILIDATILPIPPLKDAQSEVLGTVLVRDDKFRIQFLSEYDAYSISDNLNQQAPDPQCFEQVYENRTSQITGDDGILTIAGQNVSNCFTTNMAVDPTEEQLIYAQLEFTTKATRKSLPHNRKLNLAKPQLNAVVSEYPNPLTMYACIKAAGSEVCSNDEVLYKIPQEPNRYIVPLMGNISDVPSYTITLGVRSNQQEQYQSETTDIILKRFSAGASINFDVSPMKYENIQYAINAPLELELSSPFIQSPFAQNINLNTDGILIGRDPSCDVDNNDHYVKETTRGILSYVAGCKNIINKNIPFTSNGLYLWNITYTHYAGSVPAFIIMDNLETYFYTKLFSHIVSANDAFDIPLQDPEYLFTRKSNVSKIIDTGIPYSVSGMIKPHHDQHDGKNKEIIIDHFTQNEGLSEIQSISLIRIPEQWIVTRLVPESYQPISFNKNGTVSSRRILPSMWEIKVTTDTPALLKFNEAFDKQWILIGSPSKHLRCNGFANCYIIPSNNKTLYLFYWPELLSVLGLILTTIIGIVGIKIVRCNK